MKTKKKMIWWQVIEQIFIILSNAFLKSNSGVTIGIAAIIRNILTVKNKFKGLAVVLFLTLTSILGLISNNYGMVGIIPIIATAEYTIALYILKKPRDIKIALVINLIMWAFYDLTIKAYPMFVMDLLVIIITLYNLFKKKHKKHHKKRR